MNNPPRIEMAQLKLIKSVFSCNTEFRQPPSEMISIAVAMRNHGEFLDGDRRAHFIQTFKTSGDLNTPFSLNVEFGALFIMDEPIMPLERRHYMKQIFPQMVFPYMREYVAETTRRGGFTPLILNQNIFIDDEEGLDKEAESFNPALGDKWLH